MEPRPVGVPDLRHVRAGGKNAPPTASPQVAVSLTRSRTRCRTRGRACLWSCPRSAATPSSEAVSNRRPSGLNWTVSTAPPVVTTVTRRPVRVSQTATLPSEPAVATRLAVVGELDVRLSHVAASSGGGGSTSSRRARRRSAARTAPRAGSAGCRPRPARPGRSPPGSRDSAGDRLRARAPARGPSARGRSPSGAGRARRRRARP